MAVKVPPLLHKMSASAQKAWYKKHGMEMPKAETGRSAAQAKKDVGEINKKKARETAIAKAATSKKNKELVSSSERVRQMAQRRRESGEGLGGGLETNRDIISYVRAGGTIKAGRLGEETVEESKKDWKKAFSNVAKKNLQKDIGSIRSKVSRMNYIGLEPKVSERPVTARDTSRPFAEEVEQIDELKKSTLASYVNKAANQVRAKSGIAASFETQGTRKRNPENKSAYMDVAKDFRQGAKKRLTGIEKATAKLAKEEVEQIEEGNPATKEKVKNYVRGLGVKATIKGLVPFDQIHSPLRSGRKVLRTKTTAELKKEEIELDEVTKKEAESVLGGTVKEKPKMAPGKQPAGYRYVRNLARRAMKAGMKTEATSFPRGGGVINYNPKTEKSEKDGTAKLYDKETDRMQKKLAAGKMSPSQVMAKMKEEVEYIEEKLTAADPASKWISDFVASDNPKFAGKSKKERIQQALGAYYAAKREKNEEVDQVTKEGLDPVGREDKDIDNDGDSDKTDFYLHNKRKAIRNSIRKKIQAK